MSNVHTLPTRDLAIEVRLPEGAKSALILRDGDEVLAFTTVNGERVMVPVTVRK
jgi:hypothetical protein